MRLLNRPGSALHKSHHPLEAGLACSSTPAAPLTPDETPQTAAEGLTATSVHATSDASTLENEHSGQMSAHFLQRAKGFLKAEVYLTQFNGQSVVCKDYRRYAGTPAALVARWLVRHELKMLEQLGGWTHAPQAIARLSPLALAMEYIPGPLLSDVASTSDATLSQQLIRIVQQLHRQQMAHNDIRGSNVVLRDGVPVLIDFTSAVRLPRLPGTATLARMMRRFDLRHSLKLKQRTLGRPLSTREARLVMRSKRFNGVLRLWKKQILPRLKGR
ncbi:MAG: RIO1 family regulatory kinase/ATPase domain-containing protein [Cobetia crustatorum]